MIAYFCFLYVFVYARFLNFCEWPKANIVCRYANKLWNFEKFVRAYRSNHSFTYTANYDDYAMYMQLYLIVCPVKSRISFHLHNNGQLCFVKSECLRELLVRL